MHKLKQKILSSFSNLFFWKVANKRHFVPGQKYILIFGPHTSHWDMAVGGFITQHFNRDLSEEEEYKVLTPVASYMLNKPWYKFLTDSLFKIEGVPINREEATKNSQVLKDIFSFFKRKNKNGKVLLISPEGTRQPVKQWQDGWYKIAKANKAKIAISSFNYKTRTATLYHIIDPQKASKEECMKYVLDAFRQGIPRNPEWYIDIGEDKTPLESRFDP